MSSIIDSIWRVLSREISFQDYILIVVASVGVYLVLKNADFDAYRFQLSFLVFLISLAIRAITGIPLYPYVEFFFQRIPFAVYWSGLCCTIFIFFLTDKNGGFAARLQVSGLFGGCTAIVFYLVFS